MQTGKYILFALFCHCLAFSSLVSQGSADSQFLMYSADESTKQEYINYIWDFGFEENSEAIVAMQRLAEQAILKGDYKKAIEIFNEYKAEVDESLYQRIEAIVAMLSEEKLVLRTDNFGDYINSDGSEYSPMPTADGKKLYFTGVDRNGGNKSEDIFISELKGGQWADANPLEGNLNTPNNNEAPQAVSVDGNTLILFGAFEPNYFGKGDIYYSNKTLLGWGEPNHFPKPINTEHFDVDAKYTADRKHLIFTSDRPGGVGDYHPRGEYFNGSQHGNTDIYVAALAKDGSVDSVINLGEVINTRFAERKPFLHPDGTTLYFSSDGHGGLGRLDLYMSKRLNKKSWTEWSEPINMGKAFNSPFDESGVIVSTFGEDAYYAAQSREVNYGKSDIYSTEVPDHLKPEPVAGITGSVTDVDGFPLGAKIIWEDLETGEAIGEAITDPKTGEFYLVLELGKNYGVIAEKEGYFPISSNINLIEEKANKRIKLDLQMQSVDDLFGDDLESTGTNSLIYDAFDLKRDNSIKMNNLFFAYNESTILKESYSELDRVAYMLTNYPIEKVEIEGHTDSIGGASYNKKLSQNRAASVVKYLVTKGISEAKMKPVGYGMERPVAPNDTEENRQLNRRVELQISNKGKLND